MERLVSPATGITGEFDEDYFGLLNDVSTASERYSTH